MRGLLASLGILNQHALRWMFSSAEALSSISTQDFVGRQDVSKSSDDLQEFHGKVVAAPSAERACAGACAFVVVDVACKKQVSLNTRACGQVCMLSKFVCYTGVLNISVQFANRCHQH